jgi:hypothetical protein
VLEEPLILDRDDRLAHDRRDVVRSDEDAALVPAENREHCSAVRGVDDAVDVRALRRRVERRDLAGDRTDEPEREGEHRRHEEDEHQQRKTALANSAPVQRLPLLSPNPQGGRF